jgi:hypothetical protein
MKHLGDVSGFTRLIRRHCGDGVNLSETGLSITCPGGGGLEWHADGLEGECTVIMALEDVEPEKGRLGVILGSHEMIDRHACDDFDEEVARVAERESKVYYPYRGLAPIVFDARLLHSAEDSKKESWRVILWWIYN